MASSCCVQLTHSFANQICCDSTDVPLGTVTFTLVSPNGRTLWDPDLGDDGQTVIVGQSYVATLGEEPDGDPLVDLGAFLTCPLPTVDGYTLGPNGPDADGSNLPYYKVDVAIQGVATFPSTSFTWHAAPLSTAVTCDTTEDLADHLLPTAPGSGTSPSICDILNAAGCSGGGADFNPAEHSLTEFMDGWTDTPELLQVAYWDAPNNRILWEDLPGVVATDFTLEFGQSGPAEEWQSGQSFQPVRLAHGFLIAERVVVSGVSGDVTWNWALGTVPVGSATGAITVTQMSGTTLGTGGDPGDETYVALGSVSGGPGIVGYTLPAGYYVFRFTSDPVGSVRPPEDTKLYITGHYV